MHHEQLADRGCGDAQMKRAWHTSPEYLNDQADTKPKPRQIDHRSHWLHRYRSRHSLCLAAGAGAASTKRQAWRVKLFEGESCVVNLSRWRGQSEQLHALPIRCFVYIPQRRQLMPARASFLQALAGLRHHASRAPVDALKYFGQPAL